MPCVTSFANLVSSPVDTNRIVPCCMLLNVMMKDVKNFYDIRNQLLNCIDAEAKAKNSAFVASIPATPPSGRYFDLSIRLTTAKYPVDEYCFHQHYAAGLWVWLSLCARKWSDLLRVETKMFYNGSVNCSIAFFYLKRPVWVQGTIVIKQAQSVSWPDGIKGDLNHG